MVLAIIDSYYKTFGTQLHIDVNEFMLNHPVYGPELAKRNADERKLYVETHMADILIDIHTSVNEQKQEGRTVSDDIDGGVYRTIRKYYTAVYGEEPMLTNSALDKILLSEYRHYYALLSTNEVERDMHLLTHMSEILSLVHPYAVDARSGKTSKYFFKGLAREVPWFEIESDAAIDVLTEAYIECSFAGSAPETIDYSEAELADIASTVRCSSVSIWPQPFHPVPQSTSAKEEVASLRRQYCDRYLEYPNITGYALLRLCHADAHEDWLGIIHRYLSRDPVFSRIRDLLKSYSGCPRYFLPEYMERVVAMLRYFGYWFGDAIPHEVYRAIVADICAHYEVAPNGIDGAWLSTAASVLDAFCIEHNPLYWLHEQAASPFADSDINYYYSAYNALLATGRFEGLRGGTNAGKCEYVREHRSDIIKAVKGLERYRTASDRAVEESQSRFFS